MLWPQDALINLQEVALAASQHDASGQPLALNMHGHSAFVSTKQQKPLESQAHALGQSVLTKHGSVVVHTLVGCQSGAAEVLSGHFDHSSGAPRQHNPSHAHEEFHASQLGERASSDASVSAVKLPHQPAAGNSENTGQSPCDACTGRHRKHKCGRERPTNDSAANRDPSCQACYGRHRYCHIPFDILPSVYACRSCLCTSWTIRSESRLVYHTIRFWAHLFVQCAYIHQIRFGLTYFYNVGMCMKVGLMFSYHTPSQMHVHAVLQSNWCANRVSSTHVSYVKSRTCTRRLTYTHGEKNPHVYVRHHLCVFVCVCKCTCTYRHTYTHTHITSSSRPHATNAIPCRAHTCRKEKPKKHSSTASSPSPSMSAERQTDEGSSAQPQHKRQKSHDHGHRAVMGGENQNRDGNHDHGHRAVTGGENQNRDGNHDHGHRAVTGDE